MNILNRIFGRNKLKMSKHEEYLNNLLRRYTADEACIFFKDLADYPTIVRYAIRGRLGTFLRKYDKKSFVESIKNHQMFDGE